MTRAALPFRRQNEIREVHFDGRAYSVCVGYDGAGRVREVFADGAKSGSSMQAIIADACVLVSIALQHGIEPAELAHSLGRVPARHDGRESEGPASPIGMIVEALG